MSKTLTGTVERPYKFEGKNFTCTVNFSVPYEVTEDQNIGVASQLIETVNKYLVRQCTTLDAAAKDLDAKMEKLKNECKALQKEGKPNSARRKYDEMEALYAKYGPQLSSFVDSIPADGQRVLARWWADAQSANVKLRNSKIKAVIRAGAKITLAALGSGVGIASAVVTSGAAAPIALASVGAAMKLTSTSFSSVKAAFQGFGSAYNNLETAYHQAQRDLEKAKLKEMKPDKGKLDKIKAFLSSSPVKNLESALSVYQVKVREAENKLAAYGNQVGKLMEARDKLLAAVKSESDPLKKNAADLWAKIDYIFKKIELLRKNMDQAKAIASEAEKLVREAKAGKVESLGGKSLTKLATAAQVLDNAQQVAENVNTLVAVGMQVAKR